MTIEERQTGLTDKVPYAAMARRPITAKHFRLLTRAAQARTRAHAGMAVADERIADAIMTAWSEGGYSYQAIGDVVGLTKQRVDQIIRAHKT